MSGLLANWFEREDVLSDVLRSFAEATASRERLLATVARRIAEALDVACVLATVSRDKTTLEPAAFFDARDRNEALRQLSWTERIPVDSPHPLAQAHARGEPNIIENLGPAEQAAGIVHLLFVPLRARGEALGTLTLARHGEGAARFDDTAFVFAGRLAGHAALAVANGLLVEESQKQAKRLRLLSELTRDFASATGNYEALVNEIARRIGEVLGDTCAIRMITADGQHLEAVEARVIETGRAVLIPTTDPNELRSMMIAPLRAEGKVTGVATVVRSNGVPFDVDDLQLLEDLAAHASIAITNARLLADSRRVAERLRVLQEASKEFAAASHDLDKLLDKVVRTLGEQVGDLCVLRLLADDGQALASGAAVYHRDPAALEQARRDLGVTIRVGEGIIGRVVATGEPLMVAAMLAIPLQAGGRPIGVLTLSRASPARPYTQDDLRFAQDLATHATLAINNARLMASMQHELGERRKAEVALSRAEEQLRHAQKMEAVGRLAGGVAHDFNNLLSVVLSYTSFIMDETEVGDPMRDDLEQIKLAGERAAGLTRQLLAFSRQQVIEARIVDLDALVANIEQMIRRLVGEDIDIRIRKTDELGMIKADPGHLEQVVMNLVVNARDAMPSGGTLTIETANVELDDAYAREHVGVVAGPHVMLAISDTGTGMDKETQRRIFEPFFTTKEKGKGTGLGLSTVFGIVEQANGSIWLYSEVGRGTTFKIYLPRTDEKPRIATTTSELATLRGGETVLLVEDDDQVRQVARGILRRGGYSVIAARSGDEAIRLCSQEDLAIDLVLTDVVMPEMSGPDLAVELTRLRPDLKVIYMSGYTEDAIAHHNILDLGVKYYEKPLTPDTLLRKIRAVLDTSPSG